MCENACLAAQVGRGEAVGAVWALTGGYHDTTALCVRDSEFVRMSKVSTASMFLPQGEVLSKVLSEVVARLSGPCTKLK